MQRIVVVGTSGSGKTRLAQQIAEQLNIPHVELDALHWEPNWQEAELSVFCERIEAALVGDAWVVDGNYSRVRDVIWPRADAIIWLNYSFPVVMSRTVRRLLKRTLTRENLWGTGNRENLFKHLFTQDSLIWWVLKTYNRRRREYPQLFAQPEHAHLQVLEMHTPRETKLWLEALPVHEMLPTM